MIFLKFLSVILLNLFMGYGIVLTIKFLLVNRKELKWFNAKRIPLTPGYLIRKREWLLTKLTALLEDYLKDAENEEDTLSNIYNWEIKIYTNIWQHTEKIDEIRLLPKSIKNKIREIIASIGYEVMKQFLRNFVPFLLEKYEVRKKINLLSEKISIDIILDYFDRYIYKFLLIFFMIVSVTIGIYNAIILLILQ